MRRAAGGKRLLAVCAGAALVSAIGSGTAFAAAGPDVVASSTTAVTPTQITIPGVPGVPSIPGVPDLGGVGGGTGTSGSGGASNCPAQLATFYSLLNQRNVLISAINASPLNLILRNQLDSVNNQLAAAQDALFAALCSNIPSLPTNTPVDYPYNPYYNPYDYANGYDDGFDNGFAKGAATTPTTQVSSVPTGGVNTGDGSY